jgi:hypothetical protein
VYDLAKRYDLEVSMFERLVKNDFPFVRLNYQVGTMAASCLYLRRTGNIHSSQSESMNLS